MVSLIYQHMVSFIRFFLQVNGNWSKWSKWSECSKTCGGGVWTKSRSCTDPSPLNGGLDCVGSPYNTRICSIEPCPGMFICRERQNSLLSLFK